MATAFSIATLLGMASPDLGEQTFTVKAKAPDSAWTLKIESVHRDAQALIVLARFDRKPGLMGAQVITELEDSVSVKARGLPAKDVPLEVYILGQQWNWDQESSKSIYFPRKQEEMRQLHKRLESAEVLWKRPAEQA